MAVRSAGDDVGEGYSETVSGQCGLDFGERVGGQRLAIFLHYHDIRAVVAELFA